MSGSDAHDPSPPGWSDRPRQVSESSAGTRAQILRAAGVLLAEKGLDGVSLREITREAGQRNTAALQYHFRDREGLIHAYVDANVDRVGARRHAMLDELGDDGFSGLREAARVLIDPLLAELDTEDGRAFLRVAAQLINITDDVVDPDDSRGALVDAKGSVGRWAQSIGPLLPEGTVGRPLHRRFAALRFVHSELGRRARLAPDQQTGLFGDLLADLTCAVLGAEISPETRRSLRQRDESRGRREGGDDATADTGTDAGSDADGRA